MAEQGCSRAVESRTRVFLKSILTPPIKPSRVTCKSMTWVEYGRHRIWTVGLELD
jgi:hypothetical protein